MDRASRTAELAALARASLDKEPPPFRGPDDLAHRFLSAPLRAVIAVEPVRRIVLRAMAGRMPGAYGFLRCRALVGDAFVERELSTGARQLVVLGAGYDSRAYRLRQHFAPGTRVFEVDAPPTSRRKRARVSKVFGEIPAHVSYVEVDFDRETMEGPLVRAGYDRGARTAFVWEGVTYYLSRDAVSGVLGFVARNAGTGSAIIFDYLFRSVLEGTCDVPGAREHVTFVRQRGEPFTFGVEPNELADFVAAQGLALEENVLPDELAHRYLEGAPTPFLRELARFYAIAVARRER